MDITVTGPMGGKLDNNLIAYVRLAVKSFAKQLEISRLKTNIHVRVHNSMFVEDNAEGLCEAIDKRDFIIDIGLYTNWLVNLAHEMVHVKQFAREEMDTCGFRWKSRDFTNTEYWDQPWEKEARRLQYRLAETFSKEICE